MEGVGGSQTIKVNLYNTYRETCLSCLCMNEDIERRQSLEALVCSSPWECIHPGWVHSEQTGPSNHQNWEILWVWL